MGLLTTYGEHNKVTETALQIKYQVSRDMMQIVGWHKVDGSSGETFSRYPFYFYRCRRFAHKAYSFVGMDYDTAKQCQQDMIEKYTRDYVVIATEETDTEYGTQETLVIDTTKSCSTDIVCKKVDGSMWQVDIVVNEDDERFSETVPTNLDMLFAAENARDYDE